MRIRSLLGFLAATALFVAVTPVAEGTLIGYYSFDDGTASDGSGTGNHGNAGNDVFFSGTDVPFGNGQAAGTGTGGGSTRVITVPTSSTLEGINDTLTVSFWMKASTADNANWVRIFQHGNEGNPSQTWLIDRYSSNTRTNMRVDTVDDPGPPFVDGQWNQNIATDGAATFDDDAWHLVIYSIDAGSYAKYVDNSVTTGSYQHGLGLGNTRPLYIFGRHGWGEYVGLLDDIGIWDNALESAEAHAIYNLATTVDLGYGAVDAQSLFDLYAAGSGSARVGDHIWTNTSGLIGSPGDVVPAANGLYALVLDGAGNGVFATVPEPSSLLIWVPIILASIGWRRRRKGPAIGS